MALLDRFKLPDGRNNLRDSLLRQKVFLGNQAAVDKAVDLVVLEEFASGATIVQEGASDNDLFLIINGKTSVYVHGRKVADRIHGEHVGEMSLIDPMARRSATVVADEEVLVAKIAEPKFTSLANAYPDIWRFIAIQLGDRLRERAKFISEPNPQPHIFVGSSRESLQIANLIKSDLSSDPVSIYVWTDNVFGASETAIESLETELRKADFAILVLGPDDKIFSRGTDSDGPRDNVIFELGLFMGALSRPRTFFVVPADRPIKIPSDLAGVTPLKYAEADAAAEIKDVCAKIRMLVKKLGPK